MEYLQQENRVCRAGIIPYFHDLDGYLFFLMGRDKGTGNIADLGGTAESGETVLETALREYGEESRWTLPVSVESFTLLVTTPIKSKTGIWSEQSFCFVPVTPTVEVIEIDDKFQQTVPQSVYEDEMSCLAWIDRDTLANTSNVSHSIKALQPLLLDLNL